MIMFLSVQAAQKDTYEAYYLIYLYLQYVRLKLPTP